MTDQAQVDSMTPAAAPVITIDGPSGAGKGTVAMLLARELGFLLLDSGAVYRAAAVQALREQVDLSSESAVIAAIKHMDARFVPDDNDGVSVFLGGDDVTVEIRNEITADAASVIAVMPGVRRELLGIQRKFAQSPGLVADGRDMGTVVFPDAWLKIYLTASPKERANRRYNQLNRKGIKVTMEGLLQDIERRDKRDSSRVVSPLVPAENALMVDSTDISIDQILKRLIEVVNKKQASDHT